MAAKKPLTTPSTPNEATTLSSAVALPWPTPYEPPKLTPLGALQELLSVKTAGADDWMDGASGDSRVKD